MVLAWILRGYAFCTFLAMLLLYDSIKIALDNLTEDYPLIMRHNKWFALRRSKIITTALIFTFAPILNIMTISAHAQDRSLMIQTYEMIIGKALFKIAGSQDFDKEILEESLEDFLQDHAEALWIEASIKEEQDDVEDIEK